jgi:pimeloyl-ACP methyl ester carboxylesterase
MMFDPFRCMYIHGLEGTSQGAKASLLRGLFPQMLIPDFPGPLDARQARLAALLGDTSGWTLIGSSLGGLMAADFTCRRPAQVRRLVLLAPALIWPDFAAQLPPPVGVPTILYHGSRDTLIPLDLLRPVAEQLFTRLELVVVDDDHGLYRTAHAIDWPALLSE